MVRRFMMGFFFQLFVILLVLDLCKCFYMHRNFLLDSYKLSSNRCGTNATVFKWFCLCKSTTPTFYDANGEFCWGNNAILQNEGCQTFLTFGQQENEVTLSTPCQATRASMEIYLRNKMDGTLAFWDVSFSTNIKRLFVQVNGTHIRLKTYKLKGTLLGFEYTCKQPTTCDIIKIGGANEYPFELGIPTPSPSALTTSVQTTQIATSTITTTMLLTPETTTLATTTTIVPSPMLVTSSTSNQEDITPSTEVVPTAEITQTTSLSSATHLTSSVQTIFLTLSTLPVGMTTQMQPKQTTTTDAVDTVAPTSVFASTHTPVDTNTGNVSKSDCDNKMAIIIHVVVGGSTILLLVLIIIICRRSSDRKQKRIEREIDQIAKNPQPNTQNILTNDCGIIVTTVIKSQPVSKAYEVMDEALFNVQQNQNKKDPSNYQILNLVEIEQGREYTSLTNDTFARNGENAQQLKPNQRSNVDYEIPY